MAFDDNKLNNFPTQEDYFQSTDRINELIAHDEMGTAWYFNNELRKVHSRSPSFRRTMLNASRMAERYSESNIDPQTSKSIKLGALAGLIVSFDVHAFDVLNMKDIIANSGIDVFDTSHVLGDKIAEIGDIGLVLVGTRTAEVVSSWSKLIDRDPEAQEIFCRSFGIIAIGSINTINMHNTGHSKSQPGYAEFKDELDVAFDSTSFIDEITTYLNAP